MIEDLTNEFYCNDIETASNDDSEPKSDIQIPQPLNGESDTLPYASKMLKLEYVQKFTKMNISFIGQLISVHITIFYNL